MRIRTVLCGTIGILLLALSGCANPQREAKIMPIDPPAPSVVIYPSDLRGTYVVKESSPLRFCAEPVPDVALDSVQKMTATLKATLEKQPIDASVSGELAVKVVELAGRTQLLLIAREMLYRACELSLNYNASQETAWNMYATVVELVAALGKTEMTRSDAELIRSQAALDNAKAALEKVRKQENK